MRLQVLAFTLAAGLALLVGPARCGATAGGSEPGLPDTPAGRCVADYLAAYDSANDDRLQDFERRHRARSAARERAIEDFVGESLRLHDRLGRLVPLRVVSIGPAEIALLVRSESRGTDWILAFEFESQPPGRLTSLRVQPSPGPTGSVLFTAPLEHGFARDAVRRLVALLRKEYVNAPVGGFMADALLAHESRGDYAAVTSLADLALRLTADLHAVQPDPSLEVVALGDTTPAPAAAGDGPDRGDRAVARAEMLTRDIGYVALDGPPDDDAARPAIAAAMTRVADCRALVLDLRDDPGDNPSAVEFLAGYFFAEPTQLVSFADRNGDQRRQVRSLDSVPGRRVPPGTPLYVLTGPATASLAEGLAYALQHLRGAVVVGERTAGVAHVVADREIGERLVVHLPQLQGLHGITGTTWEGTGIEPDLDVPAARALAAAQEDAARRLRRGGRSRPRDPTP